MVSVIGYINGQELVASGSVIAEPPHSIRLVPIPSDPEYTVTVKINIDENLPSTSPKLETIIEDGYTIVISRAWASGSPSAHLNIGAAMNDEYLYMLSLSVSLIGQIEKYAVTLNYALTRKPR